MNEANAGFPDITAYTDDALTLLLQFDRSTANLPCTRTDGRPFRGVFSFDVLQLQRHAIVVLKLLFVAIEKVPVQSREWAGVVPG